MAAADEAAATCRLALLTGLAVLGLTLVAGVLSSTTTATSLDAVSAGSALVLPPGHEGEAIPRRARLRASRALCHSHLQGTYTYAQQSGGRPAFVSADGVYFLYYLPDSSKWMISNDMGANDGYAYTKSFDPQSGTRAFAGWFEFCWNEWRATNLTVTAASSVSRWRDSPSLAAGATPAVQSDAVDVAMRKAHDALKEQRDSFAHPLAAQLPPGVASNMNLSVSPCDNFYEYVCGNWVKRANIPPSRGGWSRSWDGAEALVKTEMKRLVTDTWPAGSNFRRLNTWYQSCMDTQRVEALGAVPLLPMLRRIDGIETLADLQDVLVDLMVMGSPTFTKFEVSEGYRDKDHNLLFISGSGLTMPDPSWYEVTFQADEPVQRVGQSNITPGGSSNHRVDRRHVVSYMQTINELAGAAPANASWIAAQTMAAETALAQWQVSEPPFGDALGPPLSSLKDIEAKFPNVPWRRVFVRMSEECHAFGHECNEKLLAEQKVIVMGSPYFFGQLNAALADDIRIHNYWKPLLRSQYIYSLAPVLSKAFLLANLKLQGYLEGVSKLQPREDKCVAATGEGLSALTDMAFVHRLFGNASRAQGTALLDHIKAAFIQNLRDVTWMDAATHAEALAKAQRMRLNLGGPKSYKMLAYPVSEKSYFDNAVNSVKCRQLRQFMDVGKTPDSNAWKFPASTVNAWYDNGGNALYIPAGMMQQPFFSAASPPAQNFGAIGSVMAHEMTHGFDDTGAWFDSESQMRDWWSRPSALQFSQRAQCIETLYSRLGIAGERVKGRATMGENIADFGGVKMAYKAFLAWHRDTHGKDAPLLERQLVRAMCASITASMFVHLRRHVRACNECTTRISTCM